MIIAITGSTGQLGRPGAQSGGIEIGDQALPDFRGLAGAGVAGDEAVEGFAMGEIQPALAGDEEFPADRGLPVIKRDLQPGGGGHFRRAQAGRAAADHGELGMKVQGREASRSAIGVNGGFNKPG